MAAEGEGVVNDGGASGAASGSSNSTASTSTGSSGSAGSSGVSGSSSQPRFEDDPRYKGVIGDLQKERKARQDFERRITEYETRIQERERQLQAMLGNRVPTDEEAKIEAAREALAKISPAFAKLDDQKIDRLLALAEQADEVGQSMEQAEIRHHRGMLESVLGEIAKTEGELTPKQRQRIANLYVAEAEANPEFFQRHKAGDKTLVADFVKGYLEDMVEPVRRRVTANEVDRHRPVPNGGSRSLVTPDNKPIDVNDPKAVEDLLVQGFRERGGRFGRR